MTGEELDVFDADGAAARPPRAGMDDVHRQGLWHRTFACWLVSLQRGTVLLQQRGPRNRIDPGSYDASASGHLAAGETPEDGWRELQEELGVTLPAKNRFAIGVFRNCARRGAYINNEFCHVFMGLWAGDMFAIRLQPGEVAACGEIAIVDGLALFGGHMAEITLGGAAGTAVRLSRADMCNHAARCENGYYLNVMRAAADLAAGRAPRLLPPL